MTDPQSTTATSRLPGPVVNIDSLAIGEEALAQIQATTQRLRSLVEENQRRVVAASGEILPGQRGEALLWNELFQEAFHLQSFQKHLEVIQASTALLAESLQARVHLADPEQPLTEVIKIPFHKRTIMPLIVLVLQWLMQNLQIQAVPTL